MSAITVAPSSTFLTTPLPIPTSLGSHADGNQCSTLQAPTGRFPGNYCYYSSDVSKQLSSHCCAQYSSEPVQTDGSGCYDYCSFGNGLLLMGNPMEYYKDCMGEEAEPVCITKQPPSHSDFAPGASATATPSGISSAAASVAATSATSTASGLPPSSGNSTCPSDFDNPTGWTPESFCYTTADVPKQKMRQCCSKITSGQVRTDESGCYTYCPMDDGMYHPESIYERMSGEWQQCMSESNAMLACQQTNRAAQGGAASASASSTMATSSITAATAMGGTPSPTAGGQDNAAGKVVGSGWSVKAMGVMLGAAVMFGLQL